MSLLAREQFEQLEEQFAASLVPRGFFRERHEYDGAFGSHYVDLVLGQSAYRLVSDGRESAVFLDYSAHYYRPIQQQEWQTLLHWPFPPSFTGKALAELSSGIELALRAHATQNAV